MVKEQTPHPGLLPAPSGVAQGEGVKSREEAEQLAGEVVRLQAELDAIEGERDKRAAAAVEFIRLEYEKEIKEKGEVALAKANAVQEWLASHRKEVLPEGGARSFETTIAKVGYRWSPAKLEARAGLSWEDVLDRIKAAGRRRVKLRDGTKVSFRERFVRVKEEVARDQLKKDLAAKLIDESDGKKLGVIVAQEEVFFISAK